MAEIDLEIINPADFTFPVHVQKLAFISGIAGLPIMDSDSTELTGKELDALNAVASLSAFQGVRKSLVNSPMYQIDTIKVLRYRQDPDNNNSLPLSLIEMSYLTRIHPCDALISLESYSVKESSYAKNTQNPENQLVYNSIYVTKTLWRIYDVSNGSILDEHTLTDTLIAWNYRSQSAANRDAILSRMTQSIQRSAYWIGITYGNRISPAWIQVSRFFYISGGREMGKAGRRAVKDDWDGAAEIWKQLAYQENQKIAARASFNMALVCELKDLMVPALDWANKSMTLHADSLTRDYIKILKERSEQLDELEKQVPDPGD